MCSQCGWIPAEEGYAMLLCGRCRELLAKRPFPQWIKLSCLSLAILLAVAAARSVGAFEGGIAYQRGQRAEKKGDFPLAAEHYAQVVKRFPDSTLPLARLTITRILAGQFEEAEVPLTRLGGRQMPKKLADEVERIVRNSMFLKR
jgi:hypothetical protein